MTGEDIPEDDSVARYCGPFYVDKGKVTPGGFVFNKPHEYLSVNWIEYLGERDLEAAVDAVCEVQRNKITVKPDGRIAVIGVGKAISAVLEADNQQLRIRHMPEPKDPSHSGISGYARGDYEVAATLARHARPFKIS